MIAPPRGQLASMSASATPDFYVTGLPAFNDNYIWLIRSASLEGIVAVDPGDAAPVIEACRRSGQQLQQVWLTHHHADHTGGVSELAAWVATRGGQLTVCGPQHEQIAGLTRPLQGGEHWALSPQLNVDVLAVPGHTRGHIAYVLRGTDTVQPPALFCGDVLFGLGCGRLFEGTADQMWTSLGRIRTLPPETRIYCAHEYTLLNLPFAESVDPGNSALMARGLEIRRLRQAGEPTVPLILAEECATNPFLRSDEVALRNAVMLPGDSAPVEVFTRLRQMRDSFKAS